VNNELERVRKEVVMAYRRYHPDIYPEGLRKSRGNLIHNSQCPGWI
jgi:hypothetical protein